MRLSNRQPLRLLIGILLILISGFVSLPAFSQGPFGATPGRTPVAAQPTRPIPGLPVNRPTGGLSPVGGMVAHIETLSDLEARTHDLQFNQIPAKEKEIREGQAVERSILQKWSASLDRFLGKPAAVDVLRDQLKALKSRLDRINRQIDKEIGRLLEQQKALPRSDPSFIASLGLHRIANYARENLGPLHTEVIGLADSPECQGDIVRDRMLIQYWDPYTNKNLGDAAEALLPLSNQFRCLSELQAARFDAILGQGIAEAEKADLLRATRQGRGMPPPTEARCEFVEGLLQPALYASEVVMHLAPPASFQWIERNLNEIAYCLPGSTLASIGFWFLDPVTAQLTQFDPCPGTLPAEGTALPSGICQPGLEFIHSLKGANMGMGDCPFTEFVRLPVIKDVGQFCKMALCREFDRMMREAKEGLEGAMGRRQSHSEQAREEKEKKEEGQVAEPPEKTPFGIRVKDSGKDVCKGMMQAPLAMGGGACGGVPIPKSGDHNPMTCDDPENPGSAKEYSGVLNGARCKLGAAQDADKPPAPPGGEKSHPPSSGQDRLYPHPPFGCEKWCSSDEKHPPLEFDEGRLYTPRPPNPPGSCGEEGCSSDCTGLESKLAHSLDCVRGGLREPSGRLEETPQPGGGPDCMGAPGCEEEHQTPGGLGEAVRLNRECLEARAMEKSPSSCWAAQCDNNQIALAGGPGEDCKCQSQGERRDGRGGLGRSPRGTQDLGSWCLMNPDDPQCHRGGGGGGGGIPPGGIPGGVGPVIPGGGGPGPGPDEGN